jgi:pyruvate/2-oxoglutarate dehydrogenase complex dihydrolipoamide dehydrogenase (E3) component
MSEIERFDVLVFGSGTGGKLTAWTSASEGLRTAVVERGLIGGSCPNIACLPTKNVVHSAKVADFVRHDRDFGSGTPQASVDIAEVRARKRRMVESLVSMHIDRYKESGAKLVFGEGSFVGPKTIQVRTSNGGVRTLYGGRVFLNLGTHAAIPDIPGLRAAKPLTHVEALELESASQPFDRSRRRLCWHGIRAGIRPLRKPCHSSGARTSVTSSRRQRCRRCASGVFSILTASMFI